VDGFEQECKDGFVWMDMCVF